jgi:AcrR family transcriptional regulator
LLDAARAVIGEKGVDAVTIGEIAERADVAFGSFYNHFESKEALVDALTEEAVVAHRDYVDAINLRFTKPAEHLANATRQTVHMAAVDPLWGWLVLRLGTGRLDLVAPLQVGLERDVREGIASGQFAEVAPELLMTIIGGSVLAAMAGRLTGVIDDEGEWHFAESILRQAGMAPGAARTTVARVRAAQPREGTTGVSATHHTKGAN